MPQFISFKDGKLGVNFAGFHAGIGVGGDAKSGGLFAEAGTPFGQSAKAGLGGGMDENGSISGRLFAGASGKTNVKVSAGLGGNVDNEKSAGGAFASAQAGNFVATSMLAGQTSSDSSAGFVQTELRPYEDKPIDIQTNINIDSTNEVKPLDSIALNTEIQTKEEKQDIKPSEVLKVYAEQQPQAVEKHIINSNNKPRRQNFHKTAFLGGYIGPGGEIIPPVVEKTEPSGERKIDIDAEATVNGDTKADVAVTKVVTYQRNPTFFQDIFNIPISTLKAVGNLLSGTVENTHVSVQKSASVQAETDSISAKREPSSVSSSTAHISVETPSASKIIDDIFAIPINTLGAVNKFLENNVAGRKSIQVRREGGEPTRVRLGPHARRRANKQIVIVQEAASQEGTVET